MSNNNESQAWTEVKGSDVQLKVLESKEGTEPKNVQSGDTVLVDIVGRQADSPDHTDGPIFQHAKGWLVTVGETFCLVRAVEYGLEKMKQGERAYIYSTSNFNFGPTGVRKYKPSMTSDEYTLPENSNVIYEIVVTQIVMDTSQLNPYFPIQRCLTMKNIANDIYQCEWELGGKARERAISLYNKGGNNMKKLLGGTYFASVEEDHPQRKQCETIMMDCYNNVIAVYLRAKRWSKAREAASVALREDSKNTKSLLRNAKAHMMDPEMSLEDKDKALTKAEKIIVYKDKEDAEIKKLRAQWKKKQAAAGK